MSFLNFSYYWENIRLMLLGGDNSAISFVPKLN